MDWITAIKTLGGMAGLGASIDFYVGQSGQTKIIDRLETAWIWLDTVWRTNFGKKEAEFAVAIIDKIAGKRIFSRQRWVFVEICILLTIAVILFRSGRWSYPPLTTMYDLFAIIVPITVLSLGLSINRILAVGFAKFCGDNVISNVIFFAASIAVSYISMLIVRPFINDVILNPSLDHFHLRILWWFEEIFGGTSPAWSFGSISYPSSSSEGSANPFKQLVEAFSPIQDAEVLKLKFFKDRSIYDVNYSMMYWEISLTRFGEILGYIPGIFRLILTSVFLFSVVSQFFKTILLTTIYRITERKQPVFTTIFSGIAAVALCAGWVCDHWTAIRL